MEGVRCGGSEGDVEVVRCGGSEGDVEGVREMWR